MKRLICFFFGHRKGGWFRTAAGARSQHAFADGVQCYRCGRLLYTYAEDGYSRVYQPRGTMAPEPIGD